MVTVAKSKLLQNLFNEVSDKEKDKIWKQFEAIANYEDIASEY